MKAVTIATIFAAASATLMCVMHVAEVGPPVPLRRRRGTSQATQLVQEAFSDEVPVAPEELSARYIMIDVNTVRWLWWPAILYLFWGMAYVCDVYFVRTIEVISERFRIPDDVAGATLMALGCNGPELALNTIAIFHPSNIGVGAVVGGEVFNVLVIIGTSLLATPDMYMPLQLGKFSFFRDVSFYIISVMLLYWVLRDGSISRMKAMTLFAGAICYTTTVVFSSAIASAFSENAMVKVASRRMSMTKRSLARVLSFVDMGADDDSEDTVDQEAIDRWHEARSCTDPEAGSVLAVRVDVRNRMMDRSHHVTTRYMWLRDDALLVSTLSDPQPCMKMVQRLNSDLVYDHNRNTHDHHWHHGGLVNEPVFLGRDGHPKERNSSRDGSFDGLGKPLLNEFDSLKKLESQPSSVPPTYDTAGFKDAPWEIIPLQDILYCERSSADQMHFNLHVHQHDSHLGKLITIELSTPEVAMMDAWVTAIRDKLTEQRRRNIDAPDAKSCVDLFEEWADWLQFPVKWFVARSIPDMDNPKLQHLYPVSFVMSMLWLAIFAWSVVQACDGIHADFGISDDVLGFTIAAAGTSFPNVFSGMCVAKQGKTSMAVANALGANVQNVFLALAIPWTVQSVFIVGGPFAMRVDNLLPATLECAITLAPVVLVYTCCGCALPRWSGFLFLFTYLVYVVFALGQEVSHCPVWPMSCPTASA